MYQVDETYLEGSLASQALIDDGTDAPQVSFGIIVLGHNNLRCLLKEICHIIGC